MPWSERCSRANDMETWWVMSVPAKPGAGARVQQRKQARVFEGREEGSEGQSSWGLDDRGWL